MLKDIFTENRTCRTFDESRKVTREELLEMVDLARISPATANVQPLCYKLVTGDDVKKIQPCTKWGGALPELHLPPEGHRPTAFIIICQDTEKFGDPAKFQRDVGICALAISLGANEKGLASCIIGAFDKEKIREAAKIPENIAPQLVIGIGKPDEERQLTSLRDGSTKYYRENGVHYVPKRELCDIVF